MTPWAYVGVQQEAKSATSLVEISVRASPNLARLIRKCAAAEASGTSAHDALLASAGIGAGEIEGLRDQVKHLTEELGQSQEISERLQGDLEKINAAVAQGDEERREQLKNVRAVEEQHRQTVAALEAQITELQETVVRKEIELGRTVSTERLNETATVALRRFKDRLSREEDIKTAALGIAGYERGQVEVALANHNRLMHPAWRNRVALWLLGSSR